MRLVVEVIGMLSQGTTLHVHRTVARRGRPVATAPRASTLQRRVSNERYVYDIVDRDQFPEGVVTTFEDPEEAAQVFAQKVGWAALSSVLAEHRYYYLFPNGSTLDWPMQSAA